MKPHKPFNWQQLPAEVRFISGKKHLTLTIANTRLEDWVDKQVIQNTLHISDRTLLSLRKSKKIPHTYFGGKIFYYLPGVLFILEQNVAANNSINCLGNY